MWFLMPIIAALIGAAVAVALYLVGEHFARAAGAGPILGFVVIVFAIWGIGRIAVHMIDYMPRDYQLTTNGSRITLVLFSIGTAYIYAVIFGLIRLALRKFGN